METNPSVTVIVATYNSSRTLKLSLESVLAQDFRHYEVWVVGDACTDDSREIVEAFADPRLNWTNLSENSGSQGAPNNEGIRRARGEYIAYLGHDDLWLPWHLSELVPFIIETGADLVHPLSAAFSPAGLAYMVGPPGSGRTYEDHFVFPSCWLHCRALTADCGVWGDHLRLSDGVDFEFMRRVHLSGKRILFHPRLSLLKFPSALWGTYAPGYQPGQREYLERMKGDPLGLEHYLLLESAFLCTRDRNPSVSVRQALSQLSSSLRHEIARLYGADRWPIPQIKLRRFQRMRRQQRQLRGLPPYRPK